MPAPIVSLNSVPQAPGVYPIIGLSGVFAGDIANPGRCYMIISGSAGPIGVPTRITSSAELLSTFDITPSTPTIPLVSRDAVDAFFKITGSIGELFILRVPAVTSPAVPTQAQYIATLNGFDDERDTHGYLISPEAYALLKTPAERLAFQVACEGLVSTFDYQWCHIIDGSPNLEFYAATPTVFNGRTINPSQPGYTGMTAAPTLVTATGATLITFYTTEQVAYSSPAGHSSYITNWGVNVEGRLVSPAACQVAVAQIRYYQDSFRVAPAGVKAPCKGLVDVAFRFTKAHQSALNGSHINITRFLKTYGVCVYGERTLYKQDSAFRYIHTRVIMNTLIQYLRTAYLPVVFDPIDGAGVAFQLAKQIAVQVCTRFWQAGALFGQTPEQAYLVRCDATNNLAFDLELGILRVDVYAAPCGVSERILVGVFRTPIGQVPQI